jgi:peptide deformylase
MAVLKIFSFPDDVLTQTAQPVERVEKEHRDFADQMLETMYDAPGIGLAANQVGSLERILVIDTDYEGDEGEEGQFVEGSDSRIIRRKNPLIIINPEITYREGELKFREACLSVPEYSAEVNRAEKIKLSYRDADGREKTLSAEGLQAVCIQHEIDHLNGTLFIDRLGPLKQDMAKKKLLKARKKAGV